MIMETFRDKKVLITGGLGFIGSNLARRLVECEAYVLLVDSLVPEYGGNLFNIRGIEERVTVNISDVRDPFSMAHLVRDQDYLFNLAGQTSHMDSMRDPYTDLDINCKAQLSILETCRNHNSKARIIFASTRQLYGKPRYLPVDENHPLQPVDVNGVNKLAGEMYHLLYHNVYDIQCVVLRLTNTYGPRMRIKDARQTFLGTWLQAVIDGLPFEVWGGEQLRDFSYVEDVVEALMLAAIHPEAVGSVFNVGSEPPISLRSLADLLIELNGGGEYRVRAFPPDRKRIDIGDYYADDRQLRTLLGWQPKIALREGLAQTLAFYRENIRQYR
jgi:UDP-glucose 4-epimerase